MNIYNETLHRLLGIRLTVEWIIGREITEHDTLAYIPDDRVLLNHQYLLNLVTAAREDINDLPEEMRRDILDDIEEVLL